MDDHAPNQKIAVRMIEKVLGAHAVEIDVASDGLEAFRMVSTLASAKGCYDIVMMDVQVRFSLAFCSLILSPSPSPLLPSLSFSFSFSLFLSSSCVCLCVCVMRVLVPVWNASTLKNGLH